MPSSELLTIGDIARREGVASWRISYAIAAYNISETQRAGIIRLFAEDKLPFIRSTLRRIAQRKGELVAS